MSFKVPEIFRVTSGSLQSAKADGNNGFFIVETALSVHRKIFCMASDGLGWEHVSVSLPGQRTPTWEVMCIIKNMFWGADDCVIQYHPQKSEYVNNHKGCLHLWRPIELVIPQPPSEMVGIKGLELE